MPRKKDRVIIDTNLWISFLISKDFSKLDKILETKEITLVLSQELVDEFITVSQRPKFQKYFTLNDIQILLQKLQYRADLITVSSDVDVCRDPKDNFLLSLATDGKATHLVTGDNDLLVLGKHGDTVILTMMQYLQGR
jgi:uncharacterized protein